MKTDKFILTQDQKEVIDIIRHRIQLSIDINKEYVINGARTKIDAKDILLAKIHEAEAILNFIDKIEKFA